MKLILSNFFERREPQNARIVDENIEPAEYFVCFGKQVLDVFCFRHVALNCDRLSTARGNLIDHLIRAFLGRRVVNDHGRAFGGKLFGNAGADAFRSARYYRYFSCESLVIHLAILFLPGLLPSKPSHTWAKPPSTNNSAPAT